jgi:hypothetical protein
VPHRTLAIRLLVTLTTLLAAAANAGWKWDGIPH